MTSKRDNTEGLTTSTTEDIVAHAERQRFFEGKTHVFLEQNNSCATLNDDGFEDFLKTVEISIAKRENVGNITVYSFVPGPERRKGLDPNLLRISAKLFKRLIEVFELPSTFLQAVFDSRYISRACGLGLFGKGETTELFYPCIITGDRCFLYSRDLGATVGFVNIVLRPPRNLYLDWKSIVATRADPSLKQRHPLHLHLVLLSQLANRCDSKMSDMRDTTVGYEVDEHQTWLKRNKRRRIYQLHRLAQEMRVNAENYGDIEAFVDLLLRANHRLECSRRDAKASERFTDTLSTILSRTQASHRWALNYAERVKILIDLAFHIATQDISEVNHEDSTSMNTIAVVTLVFLPGTLVCAIFSTVFFDIAFQEDGTEVLHFSSRIWYFFAITIPLTLAVVASWWMWKRRTVRRRLLADQLATISKPGMSISMISDGST